MFIITLFAAFSASAFAHTSPCHTKHTCPSDHHSYRWGGERLLCTSVQNERRAADKTVITSGGRRYWCSKPKTVAKVTPAGLIGESGMAVRRAATKRFYPGETWPWQSFTRLDCTGSAGVYQCSFGEGFAGTAMVTWASGLPVVKFTQVSCGSPMLQGLNPQACKVP